MLSSGVLFASEEAWARRHLGLDAPMAIGSFCMKCGRVVFSTVDKIGQTIPCPGCAEPLRIVLSLSRDEPVNLACPRCGSVLRLIRELHGRKVRCTTCQVMLEVSSTPWKLTLIEEPEKTSKPAGENLQGQIAAAAASRLNSGPAEPQSKPLTPPSLPGSSSVKESPEPHTLVAAEPSAPVAAVGLYPWVTPPELVDWAARYRQKAPCLAFGCRAGEVLNTVLGADVLVRVRRGAELRIYPGLVAVEDRETGPGWSERLSARLPAGLRAAAKATNSLARFLVLLPTSVLGFLGLPLGLALLGLIVAALVMSILRDPPVTIPAILGLSFLWVAFHLTWDYVRTRRLPQTLGKILLDPHGPYAVRKIYQNSALVPRFWRLGDVVQVLRADFSWGLGRRALILVVQDSPLPEKPGGFDLPVHLRRLRSAERRLYVLAIDEGPETADQAAAAIAEVLGVVVGRTRLGPGGLRWQ